MKGGQGAEEPELPDDFDEDRGDYVAFGNVGASNAHERAAADPKGPDARDAALGELAEKDNWNK